MNIKNNLYENDIVHVNDLLLSMSEAISYTFGPSGGHVSFTSKDTVSFDYTKDGRTVIKNMIFENDTDNRIANIIKDLVKTIKNASGDGSTSAVKLVSHLVKNAVKVLSLDNTEEYKKGALIFRNNIPKVMDKVVDDILKIIEVYKKQPSSFDDLIDIARISLNNDESLLQPFRILFNTLKEYNTKFDPKNYFNIEPSDTDKYEVMRKQGYSLPTKNFMFAPINYTNSVENAHLLMTKARINFEDLHYWSYMIQHSAGFKNPVVVIVSSIEEEAATALTELYRSFEAQDYSVKMIIMTMPSNFSSTHTTLEDLSYLLNSSVVNLIKEYITNDTGYGEKSNPFFIKTGDEELDANNPEAKFKRSLAIVNQIYAKISIAKKCDIKKMGRDLVLTVSAEDSQEPNEQLAIHINRLKDISEGETEEAASAKARLNSLDTSMYVIRVPEHLIGDGYRRASAFLDATKAINSSLKDGYIMGANTAPYEASKSILSSIDIDMDNFEEECKNYILEISNVKSLYIKDLNPVYRTLLLIIAKSYMDLIKDIIRDLDYNEVVDYNNMTMCDEKVIEPFKTDYTILLHSMSTFSILITSRALMLISPEEATKMKNLKNIAAIGDVRTSPLPSNYNTNVFATPMGDTLTKVQADNITEHKADLILPDNPMTVGKAVDMSAQVTQTPKRELTQEEINKSIQEAFAVTPIGPVKITGPLG